MNRVSFHNNIKWLAVACGVLMMSACATVVSPEIKIEDRVNARWKALLSDDLAGAYEFLSPGFRSGVTSVQYQRSLLLKKVRWISADYLSNECGEDTCNVKVSLGYKLYGVLPGVKSFEGTQTTEESWVKADGQWYYVPEQ